VIFQKQDRHPGGEGKGRVGSTERMQTLKVNRRASVLSIMNASVARWDLLIPHWSGIAHFWLLFTLQTESKDCIPARFQGQRLLSPRCTAAERGWELVVGQCTCCSYPLLPGSFRWGE